MDAVDNDVSQVLNDTMRRFEKRRQTWRWHRAAYKTEFWTENKWDKVLEGDDGLPIKVQVNQVLPFIAAQIANLFYRLPRTSAQLPNVYETTPGRQPGSGWPDIVTGYLDEWIVRSGMQRKSTYAYQQALLYDASGFKVGVDMKRKKGDMISRSWVRPIPRWELLIDEETEDEDQEAYRGHLRWERVDRVEALVGAPLPSGLKPEAMVDYLDRPTGPDEQRLKRYVRILEYYDLIEQEQRFYLVSGSTDGSYRAQQLGDTAPIPYEMPDGTPGVPIIPVVLSNVPEYPLQGVAAAGRIYQLNAERNFMMTVLANSMRRRAGLALLYKDLDDAVIAALEKGRDLALIKVEGPGSEGSLESKIAPIKLPPMDSSLPEYLGALQQAWSDTQGASDLQQGKQLKYATASESQLLAGYGEASSGDLQQRMVFAISQCAALQLVMTGEHMGKRGITVRVEGKPQQLTKDMCEMPWTIGIVDSAATPVRDMRKRDAFQQAQPVLLELTRIAAGKDEKGADLPPEVVKQAQEQLNYMVQLYGLPEQMGWDALSQVAGKAEAQKKKDVDELIQNRMPELQNAVQPPGAPPPGPPPTPPVPQQEQAPTEPVTGEGPPPVGTIVRGGPYDIVNTGRGPKPFHVVKQSDGTVMGSHETHEKALAQFRALEIVAHEED